jgi:hypothetical protein
MAKENRLAHGRPGDGTASADILGSNSEIARKLKQYYEEIVSDEIPDRFTELLTALEKADPSANRN